MSEFREIMEELKKQAEKRLGMSWDEIVKKANEDKQKREEDPIAFAYKQGNKSPNKMYKESMDQLERLTNKLE